MFKGYLLGKEYCTWKGYVKAWNDAVRKKKLRDKNGKLITRLYNEGD